MANFSVESIKLERRPLDELATVLEKGLKENFAEVKVSVVDCPDLTKPPFNLSGSGLCGATRYVDIGGPPYLLPQPQKEHYYSMKECAKLFHLPDAFIIGPACGPFRTLGLNSELIYDINLKTGINGTRCSYCTDTGYVLKEDQSATNGLMANLFCSEGKPGKVLEVKASKRTGNNDFVSTMRSSLENEYGDKPVAMGGTFILTAGKVKVHIMSDFSREPINTEEQLNNWLKFYNFDAPFMCVSEFVSHDPGLDLRITHSHGYNIDEGQGGHYHHDTTPDTCQYIGYYNTAEYIYRIDRPLHTHQLGRD